MIMLVLGGAGRLYGGLVGAAVFMIAHHYLSDLNPIYWQFWLGLLLVVVVLFARGGILGALEALRERVAARASADMTAALRTDGLVEAVRRVQGEQRRLARVPAGRAARADRPERRGQDHAHQPAHRRARRRASGDVFLGGERITALPQHERVKRGMTRTFQINTLFAGLTVLESVVLAICERKGRAGVWHRTVAQRARRDRRGARAAADRCGSTPRRTR